MPDLPAMDRSATLEVPAQSAFVTVVRSTSVTLAARAGLSVESIEDLRIAVGEAAALVLERSPEGAVLRCAFSWTDHTFSAQISVPTAVSTGPDEADFGWQLLNAMADEVRCDATGGSFSLSITMYLN